MDVLAGYGSDDSSSSAASQQQQQQQALSGVLHYSDNDDESSEHETHSTESKLSNEKNEKQSNNSPSSGGDAADRKRKRSWDNNNNAVEGGASTDDHLPPPPTSTNKSLIEWETDYTASYRVPPKNTVLQNPQLTAKLSALESSSSSNKMSWAQHLKSQHEFHNPHFFDNVVTHFGIQHALESNIPSPNFQWYELDLPAAEEQARIRHEQELLQEQHQHVPNTSHVGHGHPYGKSSMPSRPRGMSM